jgi:histone deacetylase complex regulatory component SIN3
MTEIERIRKSREVALKKLDEAMDQWGPERIQMDHTVEKSKNIFLDSYRNYKNQKISEKEFLQITNNFAQTLILEDKMIRKIRKIFEPLDAEFKNWRTGHE